MSTIWDVIQRIGDGDEFTYRELSAFHHALNPLLTTDPYRHRFQSYDDLLKYKHRIIEVINRRLNNRTHHYNSILLCSASDYLYPDYQSIGGIGWNEEDSFCEPFMEYGAHDYQYAVDANGDKGWCASAHCRYVSQEDQYVTDRYYDQYYLTCPECGDAYHVDNDLRYYSEETDEDYCCYECAENAGATGSRSLRSYSTKIEDVIRFSLNPKVRYFGLEIEHEFKDIRPAAAVDLSHGLSPDLADMAIWKEDGSLSDGAELVTVPKPLEYWRNTSISANPVRTLLSNAEWRRIARSHNTTTCGLHIHVSRCTVPEPVIAKIVYLMNEPCMNEIVTLVARRSARHSYSCAKKKPWHSDTNPNPMTSDYGTPVPAWKRARPAHSCFKRQRSDERYTPVNLTRHTLEFRIFRGTLKYATVLASIEFCDAVISYCTQYGASHMNDRDFTAWLKSAVTRKTYPALRDYLEARTVLPTRKQKQKPTDIVTPVTLSEYGFVEPTPADFELGGEWGIGAMQAFGTFTESPTSHFIRGDHWWASHSHIDALGWTGAIPVTTVTGQTISVPLRVGQTWFSPCRTTSLTIIETA